MTIEPDGILYTHVKEADVDEIVEATFGRGEAVERLLYRDPVSGEAKRGKRDIGFYAKQERRVMHDCGAIDPEDLNEYIARGGYT